MSTKAIIKSVLWILFVILLILGYFYSGSNSKNYHLERIPQNANGVILIDLKEIAKEYYVLFKQNPEELLKLSKNRLLKKTKIESIQNPGFNPFSKIVAYTEFFNANILFGIIVPEANPDHFFETFNLKNEADIVTSDKKANLCFYPKNNAFAFIDNKVGFFIKLIHQKNPIDIDYAENYHTYLINNKVNSSSSKINALNKIKNANDHISVWSNSAGFRLSNLNKLFSAMSTSINFKKGKLKLEIDADLYSNNSFTESSNILNDLKEYELAKFTTNINQELIKSVLSKHIPKKVESWLNEWNGEFYLSIIGFRNKDVLSIDTNNISKEINLPELAIGIQIDNINKFKNSIKDDSTFIQTEDGCYFWITDLLNEKCYLYFQNDYLLFSTIQLTKSKRSASFNTFHLNIDFEKLIESYPPKNIVQGALIKLFQQQIGLKEINLKYSGKTENTIHLNGSLIMGDSKKHKLVEFFEQIKAIPIKDVLSSFTSSSKLIVPPIKEVK